MPKLTLEDLHAVHDFEASRRMVEDAVQGMCGSSVPHHLSLFLYRYTTWNGFFGSGVASLAGKVGSCQKLFLDPNPRFDPPFQAFADRSVLVGSYFFDAARDEFDDRDTEHRDTHRCLAQAVVLGTLGFYEIPPLGVLEITRQPMWLEGLTDRVGVGYGASTPNDRPSVFRAIGYHLGSEVLADQEFTIIDGFLQENQPELVDYLRNNTVKIAGQEHNCYQWLSIHSDYGEDSGGVEAEHFEYAMKGARLALKYTPMDIRDEARHQMILGFLDFADDHREFFSNVTRIPEFLRPTGKVIG